MKNFRLIVCFVFGLSLVPNIVWAEEIEWTSAQGKTIRAEFVSATEDTVTLSMQGKAFVVKMSLLDADSQALARKLAANAPKPVPTKIDPVDIDHAIREVEAALEAQAALNRTIPTKIAPVELAHEVIKALAAKDFEAFKQLTCLGMGKEAFKQFMSEEDSYKVERVWDSDRDDFQEELTTDMQKVFAALTQVSDIKGYEGFDWSQAKIVEVVFDGEMKALLRSGSVDSLKYDGDVEILIQSGSTKFQLELDDCLLTPQGLLMFDEPRLKFEEPRAR